MAKKNCAQFSKNPKICAKIAQNCAKLRFFAKKSEIAEIALNCGKMRSAISSSLQAVAVAVDGRGLLGKCIEMAVAEWQWQWQWQWQCIMVVAVQGFAVP